MAKTDFKNINEYHKAFDGEVLKRMKTIRELIYKIVPKAEEKISYQIPTFMHKDSVLIHYAAFKNHVSIVYPFSKELLAEYVNEFKKYKLSKSAMQIPNNEELPVKFIEKIVKWRKKENDAVYRDRQKICSRGHSFKGSTPCPSCYPGYYKKKS